MLTKASSLIALLTTFCTLTKAQYTFDCCRTDSDCAGPRKCSDVTAQLTFQPCKTDAEECRCTQGDLGAMMCTFDDECLEGDTCQEAFDGKSCVSKQEFEEKCPLPNDPTSEPTPAPERPTTTPEPSIQLNPSKRPKKSKTPSLTPSVVEPESTSTPEPESTSSASVPPSPSPSPSPTEAICVAAEELDGVEKVYDRDFHAWVLCDAAGSCATPGHMVVWKGEGMMMKRYCAAVGCEKKVMAVNSPRWNVGGVEAKTNGLLYTGFAARFETRFEERLLSALVRIAV